MVVELREAHSGLEHTDPVLKQKNQRKSQPKQGGTGLNQQPSSSSSSGGSQNGRGASHTPQQVSTSMPEHQNISPIHNEFRAHNSTESQSKSDLKPAHQVSHGIGTTNTQATQNSQTITGSENASKNKMKEMQSSLEDINAFESFFQEMNEKTHEAMSAQIPEPERALEFLKQAEDFLKKIEKSKKSFTLPEKVM